ncbi:zinc finger protein [Trichonephila clavipes]|nr:zinc finger protein [Trichonephila clavipes]
MPIKRGGAGQQEEAKPIRTRRGRSQTRNWEKSFIVIYFSRFDRRGDMTSISNWSERTDSTDKSAATTTGLGASPSQTVIGDEYIAENSDIFREAITARKIYAAWARKLTNAKPTDPDVQLYHQEVQKAEPRGGKTGSGPSSPNSPRKGRKGKRSVDSDGFAPPKQLVRKARSPRSSPPPSPTPPSATSVEDAFEGEEEEMDSSQPAELQNQVVEPEVIKKAPHPTVFVSPKGDWRQLVALAKLIAPSFQSQMSGRFLKVTVGDELEYRNLSHWLEQTGVEFKSFMLKKKDRPIKVVIRGLPSNTEPEDIKNLKSRRRASKLRRFRK